MSRFQAFAFKCNLCRYVEGQAKMAERQDRLSDLEKRILGVLEQPPTK
jgi:hypothetical protein